MEPAAEWKTSRKRKRYPSPEEVVTNSEGKRPLLEKERNGSKSCEKQRADIHNEGYVHLPSTSQIYHHTNMTNNQIYHTTDMSYSQIYHTTDMSNSHMYHTTDMSNSQIYRTTDMSNDNYSILDVMQESEDDFVPWDFPETLSIPDIILDQDVTLDGLCNTEPAASMSWNSISRESVCICICIYMLMC